jgi:DNA-binding Lrp family transcriptional regulator
VAADMDAYEHFLTQQLLAVGGVRTANTGFVLKTRKHTTELPV